MSDEETLNLELDVISKYLKKTKTLRNFHLKAKQQEGYTDEMLLVLWEGLSENKPLVNFSL